ncbi:ribosomal RNA processing protein 1 homolog B-like isoform X2 [Hoplias malabaricus]|uniref:ribosomal RNA processing protein 1 homolog B-like isoform X2 n=1 Tax=Hoplias malabaricus TaxID=27720 RepID=UPI00346223CA
MAASIQPEILFAQRLAANERSTRSKALKTLRRYISLRSQKTEGGFSGEDLQKIWKGLFYCLWMQDKPLLQEELSERISGLIHCFQTIDSQLRYFETFLLTMKREWNGIDLLRMDKFFQLVRFVFRQVFEVLKRREWECSVINRFLEVFRVQIMQSTGGVPVGLMLHILELYMTELARVGAAELTAEQNFIFIDPFCKTLGKTKDRTLLGAISKNIFWIILENAPYAVEDLIKELHHKEEDSDSGQASEEEKGCLEEEEPKRSSFKMARGTKFNGLPENEEDDDYEISDNELLDMDKEELEEKKDNEDVGPVLQFDYGAIADRLFEFGSCSFTPSFNRAQLYRLVKRFRDLSEGIFKQEQYNDANCDDDDDAEKGRKGQLNKKNKKKRRNETQESAEESPAKKHRGCGDMPKLSEPNQDDAKRDTTEVNKMKKKKKKQKQKHLQTTKIKEMDTHKTQALEKTPVENNDKEHGGEGAVCVSVCIDASTKDVIIDPESQSESQDIETSSQISRKKSKSKKLKSKLQEIEEKVAAEFTLVGSSDKCPKDTDGEVRKCPDPEALVAKDEEKETAPPSGRKKSGERGNGNQTGESMNVHQVEDGSKSTPAKKKKQKSSIVDEEIAAEIGSDIEVLGDEAEAPGLPVLGTSRPEQPECAVVKKEKKRKQKMKKPTEDDVQIINSHAKDQTTDNASTIIFIDATSEEQELCACNFTKNRKNKKSKGKDMPVEIDLTVDVKNPDVTNGKSTGQASDPKPLKKEKKKKMKWGTSEENELLTEADELLEVEPVFLTQTHEVKQSLCTPDLLNKKTQKKQLVDLTVEEPSETAEDLVLKRQFKQKHKAVDETTANDCSPNISVKSIKKRELQTEEVEQINGHMVNEDVKISSLVTPKKRLKTKVKKASTDPEFVSFQDQTKAPTPLFCKVKSKGSPSTPLSSIKTFQTPKSEPKKVTFGLKNNKTAGQVPE